MSSTDSVHYGDPRFSQFDSCSSSSLIDSGEKCLSDEKRSNLIELDQLTDVKEYDPQIRQHLEELNRYATKINHLEKCFEVIFLF